MLVLVVLVLFVLVLVVFVLSMFLLSMSEIRFIFSSVQFIFGLPTLLAPLISEKLPAEGKHILCSVL